MVTRRIKWTLLISCCNSRLMKPFLACRLLVRARSHPFSRTKVVPAKSTGTWYKPEKVPSSFKTYKWAGLCTKPLEKKVCLGTHRGLEPALRPHRASAEMLWKRKALMEWEHWRRSILIIWYSTKVPIMLYPSLLSPLSTSPNLSGKRFLVTIMSLQSFFINCLEVQKPWYKMQFNLTTLAKNRNRI